jgi:hypothetical protein
MNRDVVPFSYARGTIPKLPKLIPDRLYEYSRLHDVAAAAQHTRKKRPALFYPFLAVTFMGYDDITWSATNECLGAAAPCVNMVEMLNHVHHGSTVDNTAFAVTVIPGDVRPHVAWRQDRFEDDVEDEFEDEFEDGNNKVSRCCMAVVQYYALGLPDCFQNVRCAVLNI